VQICGGKAGGSPVEHRNPLQARQLGQAGVVTVETPGPVKTDCVEAERAHQFGVLRPRRLFEYECVAVRDETRIRVVPATVKLDSA
jgi:hypothetical protein